METIAKIRRAHFVEGKSIQQICRALRLSRNTVRKVKRQHEPQQIVGDLLNAEISESEPLCAIDGVDGSSFRHRNVPCWVL